MREKRYTTGAFVGLFFNNQKCYDLSQLLVCAADANVLEENRNMLNNS
jgi:hypothetical protein